VSVRWNVEEAHVGAGVGALDRQARRGGTVDGDAAADHKGGGTDGGFDGDRGKLDGCVLEGRIAGEVPGDAVQVRRVRENLRERTGADGGGAGDGALRADVAEGDARAGRKVLLGVRAIDQVVVALVAVIRRVDEIRRGAGERAVGGRRQDFERDR